MFDKIRPGCSDLLHNGTRDVASIPLYTYREINLLLNKDNIRNKPFTIFRLIKQELKVDFSLCWSYLYTKKLKHRKVFKTQKSCLPI